MEVVHSLDARSATGDSPAVAIGNLDGVHLGHQALVQSAQSMARRRSVSTCVFTFSPHPQEILHPSTAGHRLTTDEEKFELLRALGVDRVFALRFDAKLAAMEPSVFFETYLAKGLRASSIHVGEDFHFGKKRSGDTEFLRACGARNGIEVCLIPQVARDGIRISSTEIRKRIQEGNLRKAADFLGRPYRLAGKVVAGAGRGRQLGIPTANLAFSPSKVAPRFGVYATRAWVRGKAYSSVSNFGVRPTFGTQHPAPHWETHLLDFSEDLYGQTLAVDIVERIRDERRFDGVEALRKQVMADIETARALV